VPSGVSVTSEPPQSAALLEFLRTPASYPRTRSVQFIETHLSWVFLTETHVYKLKKPVHRSFVDLSTLAARYRNGTEEVRLNQRLARGVYLGLVPVIRSPAGRLRLGHNGGEIVDWLVKMRRLPASHMLDFAIAHGNVDLGRLRQLGALLCHFHARAHRIDLPPARYREDLRAALLANARALEDGGYGLDLKLLRGITDCLLHYLERHAEEFDARVNAGRIVEGHGDLRPEHIYLGSPPLVIDCLEFNRALRLLDPLEELATLALECERSGAGWVGRFVHGVYSRECRDIASPSLLAFHTAARGLLRAKLCAWHLRDAAVSEHGRWLASTRQYLTLAERHAARCASPGSGQ